MSLLHIRPIKQSLRTAFSGKIDISDLNKAAEPDRDKAFLSRSLAAFALSILGDVEPDIASQSVTDGGDDNGIDAIYRDSAEETLYLVQAKWGEAGTSTIEVGEAHKFLAGFKDLINGDMSRFNEKIKRRWPEIQSALDNGGERFCLVLAYTGSAALSKHVAPLFEKALSELNDTSEVVTLEVLNQERLYTAVERHAMGRRLDLSSVALQNWGVVDEPYQSYYGCVEATEVGQWHKEHGSRLFNRNIRKFIGRTDANEKMKETLSKTPENFWYFNNGITALAEEVIKKPIGGASRQTGIFECKGFTVVNGAQTVGTIGALFAAGDSSLQRARVMIRIISLSKGPGEFADQVTKATNTQNRIEPRDFVSLDPEQRRIQVELHAGGIGYALKTGDSISGEGFDIEEATVALACGYSDISYAVQAKSGIGRFWYDLAKPPYKILFNSSTSGAQIWKAVQILRGVEKSLSKVKGSASKREAAVATHGNRFILHHVFKKLSVKLGGEDIGSALTEVDTLVPGLVSETASAIDTKYPDSYIAALFKNVSKCTNLL